MGYYTHYSFEIHSYGENKTIEDRDVATKILEMTEENDRFYPLVQEIENNGGAEYYTGRHGLELEYSESVKWYEHDDEMRELSLEFPELTFKLHGCGEEDGDIWDAYYRDGKSCRYEPVMPKFNENDLE